jgi:hypothetical protein
MRKRFDAQLETGQLLIEDTLHPSESRWEGKFNNLIMYNTKEHRQAFNLDYPEQTKCSSG